jgi:hypothetical protein
LRDRILLKRDGYINEIRIDEHGVAHHRRLQPNRKAILEQNAELRKNKGAIRNVDGMRLAADIPLADIQMLDKFFPGIANPGHPDYKYQMRRFLQSPASAPYKVEAGSRTNAGHIQVK